MEVTLPPELAKFIKTKIKDGPYQQASDVVSEALRQFQQKDRARTSGTASKAPWSILGLSQGEDIEALVFIVLMNAAKSADQDLKALMDEVKAMTKAKQALRDLISKVNKDVAANAGQINGRPPLDLSTGMGTEEAYHRAPMPVPDPDSIGGVRFVYTNLYNGQLSDVAELRAILDGLKGQLYNMSEMGDMESLRLQMAMDRYSKMIATLSNVMKKLSDTGDAITQNLK